MLVSDILSKASIYQNIGFVENSIHRDIKFSICRIVELFHLSEYRIFDIHRTFDISKHLIFHIPEYRIFDISYASSVFCPPSTPWRPPRVLVCGYWTSLPCHVPGIKYRHCNDYVVVVVVVATLNRSFSVPSDISTPTQCPSWDFILGTCQYNFLWSTDC